MDALQQIMPFHSYQDTGLKTVKISYMYNDKTRDTIYSTPTQIIGRIVDIVFQDIPTAYEHVRLAVRNSQAQLTYITLDMVEKITLLPQRIFDLD